VCNLFAIAFDAFGREEPYPLYPSRNLLANPDAHPLWRTLPIQSGIRVAEL